MQPEDLRRLKGLSGSGRDQRLPRRLEPDAGFIEQWRVGGGWRRGAKQENRGCFAGTFRPPAHQRRGPYRVCFTSLSLTAAGAMPGAEEARPRVRGWDAHVGDSDARWAGRRLSSAEPSLLTSWSDLPLWPAWEAAGVSHSEKSSRVPLKSHHLGSPMAGEASLNNADLRSGLGSPRKCFTRSQWSSR